MENREAGRARKTGVREFRKVCLDRFCQRFLGKAVPLCWCVLDGAKAGRGEEGACYGSKTTCLAMSSVTRMLRTNTANLRSISILPRRPVLLRIFPFYCLYFSLSRRHRSHCRKHIRNRSISRSIRRLPIPTQALHQAQRLSSHQTSRQHLFCTPDGSRNNRPRVAGRRCIW